MLRAAEGVTALNRRIFGLTKWLVYAIAGLMLFEVVSRYSFHKPDKLGAGAGNPAVRPVLSVGGAIPAAHGRTRSRSTSCRRAPPVASSRFLPSSAHSWRLLFGAMLLRYSAPLAYQAYEYGETSYSAWNPVVWPAKSVLPLAAVLLILQALAEIVFALRGKAA